MSHPSKLNLLQKLSLFDDTWSPRIVGDVNDVQVKLTKLDGEFPWHRHEAEDELFLVISGRLVLQFRDGEEVIGPGELIIVPRGVEHRPVADAGTSVLLVEPRTTLNTGNLRNERTIERLPRI